MQDCLSESQRCFEVGQRVIERNSIKSCDFPRKQPVDKRKCFSTFVVCGDYKVHI